MLDLRRSQVPRWETKQPALSGTRPRFPACVFHRPLHIHPFLSRMRAFVVNQYAHPSKIPLFVLLHPQGFDATEDDLCRVNNAPEPVPKEGEVLCDVYTAYVSKPIQILPDPKAQMDLTALASSSALNFFDILQTQGKYQSASRDNLRLFPLSFLRTDSPPTSYRPTSFPICCRCRVCRSHLQELSYPTQLSLQARRSGVRFLSGSVCGQGCHKLEANLPHP